MIGVDIGGTNLLVGIVEDGSVTKRLHAPIVKRGDFEAVAKQTCERVLQLGATDLDSIGISIAGSVDVNKGVVLRAQNLDWDNAPLASYVSAELGCRVVIENDVTAAAWGEFTYGAGAGSDSIFAVWIGTGIGGGLILDGKIWRGPLGTGGEFGMGISNPEPTAKNRVLESFASRSGLQHVMRNPNLDTPTLAAAYGKDTYITETVNDGARRIGTSIANVVTLLSLDRVVLGGGLVEALGEPYMQCIRNQFTADVFPPHCQQCTFAMTQLGPDAGMLGAAALAS